MPQKQMPSNPQDISRKSIVSDITDEKLQEMAQSEHAQKFIEKMEAGTARLEQRKKVFQKKLKRYFVILSS